jgi:transposase
MRFVPVKSAERQAALLDHKTRDFLVRQRTQLVTPEAYLRHDTIRAHLSEFGIVVAKGIHNVDRLLEAAKDLPKAARPAVDMLADPISRSNRIHRDAGLTRFRNSPCFDLFRPATPTIRIDHRT